MQIVTVNYVAVLSSWVLYQTNIDWFIDWYRDFYHAQRDKVPSIYYSFKWTSGGERAHPQGRSQNGRDI